MSVLIGSARSNEFGGISGGQPGDQTGHECETQAWYEHPYGWVVIRAKDPEVRELIAECMEKLCTNPAYGYDQPRDHDGIRAAQPFGYDPSKVETPTSIDCAKAVRLCVLYAGTQLHILSLANCPDFYTGTETNVLAATGQFEILRSDDYTKSDRLLLRGDILNTLRQGHTVVVLTDGEGEAQVGQYRATGNVYIRTGPGTEYNAIGILKKGEMAAVDMIFDGWVYGLANGKSGYISRKWLEPITQPKMLTATGNLYLRKGPGVLYGTIATIFKGDKVQPTGEEKTVLGRVWYEVIYDGVRGWASSKYLE